MRTHYSLIYSTHNGDDAPQNPLSWLQTLSSGKPIWSLKSTYYI